MTKAEQYAHDVVEGKVLVGKWIKLAAERFLADLERDDLIWDVDEIKKANFFAEQIVHIPELRIKNTIPPPFAFWFEQIYGWKYKETGERRFREAYIQVARKNFKTFYVSIVSLIELLLYHDTYPEILHGANSRDQALICTGKTGEIIKKSPQLRDLWLKVDNKNNSGPLKVFTHKEETIKITYEDINRRGKIEAMPKNPGDGGNPSIGVIDEFHEAKDSVLLETIKSGQGQRKNPLTLVITSPGHNKDGPCYSVLRAKSVSTLEGNIDADRNLAIMFELDSEEEKGDLKMWAKSNPMVDYSETLWPYLKERKLEAESMKGSEAVNIYIKNAGLWLDQASIWVPSDIIQANNEEIDEELLLGATCGAGVDLSAGGDLNAFVLVFPDIEGKVVVKSHFWIPEEKIKKQRFDMVDYQRWVDKGYVTVFEGDTVEYDVMAKYMNDEMDKYNVETMACDSKYLASLATFMKDSNYVQDGFMEKVGQGFYLSQAINYIEYLLYKKQFNFMHNPVMRWNLTNTEIKVGNHGDKMMVKDNPTKRIDGSTALATCVQKLLELRLLDYNYFTSIGD